MREPERRLFLGRAIGVNEVPRLVLGRPYEYPLFSIDQLAEVVSGQILPLTDQRTRLHPFAVLSEGDIANDGRKSVAAHVLGQLVLVETFFVAVTAAANT